MLETVVATAIASFPVVTTLAALRFAAWAEERREERVGRQIALTDAIHAQLGAVTAPVVTRGASGGWRVATSVPVDRPELAGDILSIARRVFADVPADHPERLEIVLLPREDRNGRESLRRRGHGRGAPRGGAGARGAARPAVLPAA